MRTETGRFLFVGLYSAIIARCICSALGASEIGKSEWLTRSPLHHPSLRYPRAAVHAHRYRVTGRSLATMWGRRAPGPFGGVIRSSSLACCGISSHCTGGAWSRPLNATATTKWGQPSPRSTERHQAVILPCRALLMVPGPWSEHLAMSLKLAIAPELESMKICKSPWPWSFLRLSPESEATPQSDP